MTFRWLLGTGPVMLGMASQAGAQPARPSVAPADMKAVTPALARYTDEVLFGDNWENPQLPKRDRSLVTISALVAGGKVEQLRGHLARALDNGVKPSQISGTLTHLAFYSGWPKAMTGAELVRAAISESEAVDPERAVIVARRASGPLRNGPETNFTGKVQVSAPFTAAAPSRLSGATVTFQPGARTNWHSHPLGQTLIVTEGIGWTQVEGGPVIEMHPGDVVVTPPGVRHWHGASQSSAMSHVAIAEAADGKVVDWFEPVPDPVYRLGRKARQGG